MNKLNIKFIYKKKIITFLTIVFFSLTALPALAQDLGLPQAGDLGLGSASPMQIITNVIKVILGFLAVITLIMILLGGFQIMTAGGNDEKIQTARKTITGAIIGLVIILSAYGLTDWLIRTIVDITSGSGGNIPTS